MKRASLAALLITFLAIPLAGGTAPRLAGARQGQPAQAGQAKAVNAAARPVHLNFAAGRANFPRIMVWLAEMMWNSVLPRGSFTATIEYTGSSYANLVRRLGEDRADVIVTTPAALATMASKGTGMFDTPYPHIRGLFKIPQVDPVTLAVAKSLGVSSLDEVKARRLPLRLATGFLNGDDGVGFLALEVLKAHGISKQELESWGGAVLGDEPSGNAMKLVETGQANAILHEGMVLFSDQFRALNEKVPMRVLTVPDKVMAHVAPLGFPAFPRLIRPGEAPGVEADVRTIDFSHWIVLVNSNVSDELAYLLAKAGAERHDYFEAQYVGQKDAPKMDPQTMWADLGVPLHPGAERYFREKGLMKSPR